MSRPKAFDPDEILEKAMLLFWKKGFHATSIQELVDVLEINRASLYGTFGGKEALFLKALNRYQNRITSRINELLAHEESAKQALDVIFKDIIDEIYADEDRKGCFLVNSIAELLPGTGDATALLTKMSRSFENLFESVLKEGVETGEFRPDLDVKAAGSFLFTIYTGLKITAKGSPDRMLLNAAATQALQLL